MDSGVFLCPVSEQLRNESGQCAGNYRTKLLEGSWLIGAFVASSGRPGTQTETDNFHESRKRVRVCGRPVDCADECEEEKKCDLKSAPPKCE